MKTYLCELLTPVDPIQARDLVNESRFLMQLKEDGERLIVDTYFGGRIGYDRKNEITALSPELLEQLKDLQADCVFDGENVNGHYVVFDIMEFDGVDVRGIGYADRLRILSNVNLGGATIVPTWWGTWDKSQALLDLMERGAEGVVFKDCFATWQPGRAGQHYKFKFWDSASCRVADKSLRADRRDDKHSIALELIDGDGSWRAMGFCTIHNSQALPAIGSIVEIRYLYAQADGLYQPSYLGIRRDLDAADCGLDQLKWKTERGDYVV